MNQRELDELESGADVMAGLRAENLNPVQNKRAIARRTTLTEDPKWAGPGFTRRNEESTS